LWQCLFGPTPIRISYTTLPVLSAIFQVDIGYQWQNVFILDFIGAKDDEFSGTSL